MKVWAEGNKIYYDMIIEGITPNWIELPANIKEFKLSGDHLFVKGEEANFIIQNITDHRKTVVYDMRTGRYPRYLEDAFYLEFPKD